MLTRKKPSMLWGASALVFVACVPVGNPATQPAVVLMGAIDPPPVHALIGHRARLDLSSEQVAVLDSIGREVNQDNAPVIRRLREMRGDFRGRPSPEVQPSEPIPPDEEVRMLVERLGQNNQQAASAVQDVLTPEQETQICDLFELTDQERAQRAEQRRRSARRAGLQRESQRAVVGNVMQVDAVWTWCGEARTETQSASASR